MDQTNTHLKRSLSLSSMVFYGLGTIIGAGIYVLIGEIVSQAGAWAPLSFIVAAVIASFTGLSYAELVGRYPRSAGEAIYVSEAFRQPWLTQLVGWSVVLTGLVSASTLLKGFVGYYMSLFGGVEYLVVIIALTLMCALACIGVKHSVNVAVFITVLELVGLLLVVSVSAEALAIQANWQQWQESLPNPSWRGIAVASFLAFYAFIGFEDMVNMAEEVKDASKNLPKAIILTTIVSTLIYLVVAFVAVIVIPNNELANSTAPLTTIVSQSTWFPAPLLSLISLIAILNGVIVQLLMTPRVIYGMTQNASSLHFLSTINRTTQTPIIATIVVSVFALIFALLLPLAELAQLTSGIILCLFAIINAALIVLKRREPYHGFQVYGWVPVLGVVTSLLLLLTQWFV
jgi:basic amino acid/polyamine antiporter, APA family